MPGNLKISKSFKELVSRSSLNSQGPGFRRKMSNRDQYQHPKILSTKFVDLVFRTNVNSKMNSIEANRNSLEANRDSILVNRSKLSSVQEEINSIKIKSIDSSKIESMTKP